MYVCMSLGLSKYLLEPNKWSIILLYLFFK